MGRVYKNETWTDAVSKTATSRANKIGGGAADKSSSAAAGADKSSSAAAGADKSSSAAQASADKKPSCAARMRVQIDASADKKPSSAAGADKSSSAAGADKKSSSAAGASADKKTSSAADASADEKTKSAAGASVTDEVKTPSQSDDEDQGAGEVVQAKPPNPQWWNTSEWGKRRGGKGMQFKREETLATPYFVGLLQKLKAGECSGTEMMELKQVMGQQRLLQLQAQYKAEARKARSA